MCFFPFEKSDAESQDIDVRVGIVARLNLSDTFDYLFSYPEEKEIEGMYTEAFTVRVGIRSPKYEYWNKVGVHYLVLGSYSTTPDQIVTEVYLYDLKRTKIVDGKEVPVIRRQHL